MLSLIQLQKTSFVRSKG